MAKRILLATRNRGKQRELQELLSGAEWEVLTLHDVPEVPDVEEDGETFLENAGKKARAVSKHSGLIALADDSGLEVDALGKAPGIRSARYARGEGSSDEENTARVLKEMEKVADEKRTARFVCAAVAAQGDRILFSTEQKVEGMVMREPIGTNGFGYDPIFYYPPYKKTFAQVDSERKNAVSHRGKAVREVVAFLQNFNCEMTNQ